jgi:hypothetical protein
MSTEVTTEVETMGRKATGTIERAADGTAILRVTIGKKTRIPIATKRRSTESTFAEVAILIAGYCQHLYAKHGLTKAQIKSAVTSAAASMAHDRSDVALKAWREIVATDALAGFAAAAARGGATFESVARDWLSGKIAAKYGADYAPGTHGVRDLRMLVKMVFPIIGATPIGDCGAAHLARAYDNMQAINPRIRDETRIGYWKVARRVLSLAHYPLGLIPGDPIPRGVQPKAKDPRRLPDLLPEDDAELLACRKVSLDDRMFYGTLHREGPRKGEALRLTWADLDADGLFHVYRTKTRTFGEWVAEPDLRRAMKIYREHFRPGEPDSAIIFRTDKGAPHRVKARAIQYRRALRKAGVLKRRPELAQHGHREGDRRQIHLHDPRRFMVTLATAQGKGDGHIRARTGHTTAKMIAHYTGRAEVLRALGKTTLKDMDKVIPEIAEIAARFRRKMPVRTTEKQKTRKKKAG